jgi:hypothetical protein
VARSASPAASVRPPARASHQHRPRPLARVEALSRLPVPLRDCRPVVRHDGHRATCPSRLLRPHMPGSGLPVAPWPPCRLPLTARRRRGAVASRVGGGGGGVVCRRTRRSVCGRELKCERERKVGGFGKNNISNRASHEPLVTFMPPWQLTVHANNQTN